MSLVSDALRKARQEVAEREGHPPRPHFPSVVSRPRRGSRLGLGVLLGALITLLAVAGGGLAAWFLLAGTTSEQSRAAAALEGVQPATASEKTPQGMPAPTEDSAAPAAPSRPPPKRGLPAGSAPPPASAAAAAADEPRAPTVGADVAVVPRATAAAHPDVLPTRPPPPPSRPAGPREFVAEAHVGDATLVLDYIAYRPSDPFAQINGVELHEGSHIEGFTVEKIDRDRVELRDEHGLVVLRVR